MCVLGCMLRSHARNGNEFRTPGHHWLPANHWDAWFLNSSKSETRLKFMKLGMLSWSGINMPWYKFVPFGAGLGISFSQKRDAFGRERATFGDETISVASYCFQNFYSVNIEQQECCVIFVIFWGSFVHFFALTKLSMHFMCIIQIWTAFTCSSAYKLVEKSNLSPWVHA